MRPAVTLRQRPHYDCLRTFPVVDEALVDGVVVRSQLQPLTQDEIERGIAEHSAKYPGQGPAKRVGKLRGVALSRSRSAAE